MSKIAQIRHRFEEARAAIRRGVTQTGPTHLNLELKFEDEEDLATHYLQAVADIQYLLARQHEFKPGEPVTFTCGLGSCDTHVEDVQTVYVLPGGTRANARELKLRT